MASDGASGYRRMVNSPLSVERSYIEDKMTLVNEQENANACSGVLRSHARFLNSNERRASMDHLQPMDKLLAKLNQQNLMVQNSVQAQSLANTTSSGSSQGCGSQAIQTPQPMSPAFQIFEDGHSLEHTAAAFGGNGHKGFGGVDHGVQGENEAAFYKSKLVEAEARIALIDQELVQNRQTKHTTIESNMRQSLKPDYSQASSSERPSFGLPHLNQVAPRFDSDTSSPWSPVIGSRQIGNAMINGNGMDRARAVWANSPAQHASSPYGFRPTQESAQIPYESVGNGYPTQPYGTRQTPTSGHFSAVSMNGSLGSFYKEDPDRRDLFMPQSNYGRGIPTFNNRSHSGFANTGGNFDGTAHNAVYNQESYGSHLAMPSPTTMGVPLSPMAPEFNVHDVTNWKPDDGTSDEMTFLPTTEPLNYRRMLDRSVSCNWRYIVDKIVCSNDQQASIFLQQKLKVATPEQKYEIVESIVSQAYPLMVNRFGNFLVQRCFEHGTSEQVIKIAEAIRGNTLALSMDAFGCHVVQKAFDSVPEDYKAIMVGELLRRIPETVIHRYACHVWQKLFELRWTTTPPQIMKYVNDALRGMWHEVALGETGSLVVQNIFENCLEDDKRPCIEEVLASIDIVAHGQFGNWCIQHICEHGAPADRSRAIDHVIRYATEYSIDQFASKVVEKCLKIGSVEFLNRYLDRVCEGRADRPRIPLIDIASDQYGNYLIQYILTNANAQHREVVAAHIRKHMVSLRGSKFGSRVGMLCTNPAVSTRPGPVTSTAIIGRMPLPANQQPRFNGGYGR